ncbi:MAG: hypothetical protein WBG20_06470 [Candidatus Deferrimicrobiaceae bacterium]
MPVSAPGNGATPLGKLCVSAVKVRWYVGFAGESRVHVPGRSGRIVRIRYPFIALELSRKAITLFPGVPSRGALTIRIRVSGISFPSTTSFPLKNQWRECSLLDWERSKHSTSVGLRLRSFTKRS